MMLNELTWTYWACPSAARAPNGLFGPNSFTFVAPFWVKVYFQPNIGMWGVQSVAMECPAHTALFQSIWNHPAEENAGDKTKEDDGENSKEKLKDISNTDKET